MSYVSRCSRTVGLLLTLAAANLGHAVADEPWLVVDVERPARLLEHELVAEVRAALDESPDYRDRLRSPEVERLRELSEVLEQALGIDWEVGLDRLVRRARLQAFDPGKPRSAVLVVESESAGTLRAVLSAVAAKVPPVAVLLEEAGQPVVHQLGQAFVAVDGPRLVVSGEEDRVRAALQNGLVESAADSPLLSARLDVERFRDQLNDDANLRLPGRDPGSVATVGEWLNRIRLGRDLKLTLDTDDGRLAVSAELTSDPAEHPVPGFFAPDDARSPRPLRPPGTILSFGWYRDFTRMWDARGDLVVKSALDQMEKRDEELQGELGVLGLTRRPSEIFGMLGTEYHVVVTRDESPRYDVPREIRLPHAAVAVSLRDEAAFEEAIGPVLRFFGVILSGQQKMLVVRAEHGGATITTARFRDDAKSRSTGNALRYHFAPSWTVARGHLVVGSTDRVVTRVLDELAGRGSADGSPRPTESLHVDLVEAATALRDAAPYVVTQRQFEDGLSPERAETELRVAETVLRAVQSVQVSTDVDESAVRVRLTVGPEPSQREETP